jgi:hypothetical protein
MTALKSRLQKLERADQTDGPRLVLLFAGETPTPEQQAHIDAGGKLIRFALPRAADRPPLSLPEG